MVTAKASPGGCAMKTMLYKYGNLTQILTFTSSKLLACTACGACLLAAACLCCQAHSDPCSSCACFDCNHWRVLIAKRSCPVNLHFSLIGRCSWYKTAHVSPESVLTPQSLHFTDISAAVHAWYEVSVWCKFFVFRWDSSQGSTGRSRGFPYYRTPLRIQRCVNNNVLYAAAPLHCNCRICVNLVSLFASSC